jgi:flagellar biosynthesis/type III secretory pathway M-ring protein FliF/YscJ
MEPWRRTLSQLRELFNNLAPAQRLTLVLVPLLILAGLGLVMQGTGGPTEEALLSGKVFSSDELEKAKAALRNGNFTQYRVDGQRILVAQAEAARYNAALVTGQGVPASFGDDMERAIADNNPLLGVSDAQHRERIDLGKSRELIKIIKAVPFVEDASLVPHRPRQRIFHGEAKMTALLAVKLRIGRELPGDLAMSLRQIVAGGFGMAPADVTVVDMTTGKAPRLLENDDRRGQAYVERLREFTALYQQKIAEALSYIPNVLVSVNVEVAQSTAEGGTGAPVAGSALAGYTPSSVQVAIAVPKDYYREIALRQGVDATNRAALRKKVTQLKIETERAVREKIVRLVPATTGGMANDAINVSSYDRLEAADTHIAVPVSNQVREVVMQWGGPAGLAVFAVWALWIANRNKKRRPESDSPAADELATERTQPMPAASAAIEQPPGRGATARRAQLQILVRENPKLAAAALRGWLAPQRP